MTQHLAKFALALSLVAACGEPPPDAGSDPAPSPDIEHTEPAAPRTIDDANAELARASQELAALTRAATDPVTTRILPSGLEVSQESVNVAHHWREDQTNMAIICTDDLYTVDNLSLGFGGDDAAPSAISFEISWAGEAVCDRKINVTTTQDATPADGALPVRVRVAAPAPVDLSTTPRGTVNAVYDAMVEGDGRTGTSVMRCAIDRQNPQIPPDRSGFMLRCANILFETIMDADALPGRNHSAGVRISLLVLD
ncbi:MAG: hypothetical protein AAGH42_08270 [Pseudomonadota bacterium]